MANTAGGALSVCPFYLRDEKKSITCEGFLNESRIKIEFRDSEQRENWQKNNCYLFRCDCPYKKIIEKKYE